MCGVLFDCVCCSVWLCAVASLRSVLARPSIRVGALLLLRGAALGPLVGNGSQRGSRREDPDAVISSRRLPTRVHTAVRVHRTERCTQQCAVETCRVQPTGIVTRVDGRGLAHGPSPLAADCACGCPMMADWCPPTSRSNRGRR